MDALEQVIPCWEDGGALYNLACVAARGGQLERAMDYVQAIVDRGRSVFAMVGDPDFANLRTYPAFVALTEA